MAVKYYDFFVKGNTEAVVTFIDGFMRGKGVKSGYIFTKDLPFRTHIIKEFIKFHGDIVHLICRGSLRSAIRSAIRQGGDMHEFELVESRSLERAFFEFKFTTANRKSAGTIKRLLGSVSGGARVVDCEPEETVNPGAKGTEGYAPLHEYQFSGSGVVEGGVEAVLKFWHKFSSNDFVVCEEIDLAY